MPTSSVKTRTGIASKIREYLQEHGDASAPEMGKAFGFPTYEFTKVNNALNSLERIKDGNPRIVRRENRDALGRIVWGLEWNDAPPADGADPAKAQPTADASVDLDGRTLADCVKRFAFPIQASGDHFISAPKTDTGVRFWLSDKGELQIERGASDFRFDVATTKRLYKLLVGCVVLEEA